MKNLTFLIKSICFFLGVIILCSRCERDTFPREYANIYGNWTIRNISGGFSGGSIEPGFDILSIDPGMRFYIYRNDTLLTQGTIEITNETDDYLEADFNSKVNYIGVFGDKTIRLRNDTLIISDNCSDCYSSIFVRSEIYQNSNYIQSSKTLDFVEVTNFPIGFEKHFNSIYFQSENLGFLTSDDGSILKSTDGGRNWRQVHEKNKLPLYGIAFINEQVGFAVGGQAGCGGTGCRVPGYLMLKTSDGGESWDSIPLPFKQAELKRIKFYSQDFGITAGAGAILLTRDRGETWSDLTTEDMRGANNIFIFNEDVAYLTGMRKELFKTRDGGNSWQKLSYEPQDYIRSIMFLNEQVGFISFYNALSKTTDGGLTWKKVDYAPVDARLLNFTSVNNGVVFGSRTYACNKWDVWDAHFNVLIDGKWYGDSRVGFYTDPFALDAKTYYSITWDNKISVIKINN